MSAWDDFLTVGNFQLAWDRVVRSKHGDTKDRLALRAFNFSLERNLRLLIDRIARDTYKPFPALKTYQPKSAGTLRTKPILTVPDRIVYQAVGNVIADSTAPHLIIFADQQVYAHLYAGARRKYMLKNWREQYRKFIKALERAWSRGNRWVVQADIASYYDSIDHNLLIDLIRHWVPDDGLLQFLRKCLRTWTPHRDVLYLDRGLPQGYETSDFLATLFLYSVDHELCEKGYDDKYRRYVDDIRLFLSTKDKAQRALIDLDLSLKSIGLILQANKTSIRRIDSIDDQRDPQWGLLSFVDQIAPTQPRQAQGELRRVFFDALDAMSDEFAESRLVFALGRLDRYDDVRDQVLRLLDTVPWRSRSLTGYLQVFTGDAYTIDRLTDFVQRHRVYGWHLKNCLECLLQIARPEDLYAICQEWVRESSLPWYQRLAAAEGLSQIPESVAFCNAWAEREGNYMVREALFASCYKLANDLPQQTRVIRAMLTDQDEAIKRVGLYFLLAHDELSWSEFEDVEDQLGPLRNLVPDLVPGEEDVEGECYIAKVFVDFFGVDAAAGVNFEPRLDGVYENAKQHLRCAIGSHDTSPSRYVSRLDNFNNILVWAIYDHLLPNENYVRDDTVNNLNRTVFRELCPVVAGAFLQCHELRCNCAEPHPYSRSLSSVSEEVSYRERDEVTDYLRAAYRQLTELFS